MTKKSTEQPKKYLVKVVIRPEGYNKIILEGLFIPKGHTCNANKIKKQCWECLSANIAFKQHGIDPDKVEKEITVKAVPADFLIVEDKE